MSGETISPEHQRESIRVLADAMKNGWITQHGRLPDLYNEVNHAIDISSDEGRAFNDYCTQLLMKLRPQHDNETNPVQFVLLDTDDFNGYIIPEGQPTVIALSRGLIEKTKHNEAGLAFVIAHEYTHFLSHQQRRGGHGRKLEEVIADHVPLEWVHEAGYSRMAAVEFLADLFLDAASLESLDKSASTIRLTQADAEAVAVTLSDSHLRDAHRLAALTDRIGGTDVDRGENSLNQKRTPIPASFINLVHNAKGTTFIDTLRNDPRFMEADPLEQLRQLKPRLKDSTEAMPWRAEQIKQLLSEITDDYQRFDWDEVGKDIDDADEEFEALGNSYVHELKNKQLFNNLYPVIAREMLGERDTTKPAGSLKPIAKQLEALVKAKDQVAFAKAYEALKPELATIAELPVNSLTWPNFDTGLRSFDEVYATRGDKQVVAWNDHAEWAINYATKFQDEGPMRLLLQMGAYDPRLIEHSSEENLKQLAKDLLQDRGLGTPLGHNMGNIGFVMDRDAEGEFLAYAGYATEKYRHIHDRVIADINAKYEGESRKIAKRFSFDDLDTEERHASLAAINQEQIEKRAAYSSSPKKTDFWPDKGAAFVKTFPARAKELSAYLKTPEILTHDPAKDPMASLIRTMLDGNIGELDADRYEHLGTLSPENRFFMAERTRLLVTQNIVTTDMVNQALDIIEKDIYPTVACRTLLEQAFLAVLHSEDGKELFRSFYLGREDGLDYKHFFTPGALVSTEESLGCPFWGLYHVGESADREEKSDFADVIDSHFTLEEKLRFMSENHIMGPGVTRQQQRNFAYPVDDNNFWGHSLMNGDEVAGHYDEIDNHKARVAYIDQLTLQLKLLTDHGFIGHAEIVNRTYDRKLDLALHSDKPDHYVEYSNQDPESWDDDGGDEKKPKQPVAKKEETDIDLATLSPAQLFAHLDRVAQEREDAKEAEHGNESGSWLDYQGKISLDDLEQKKTIPLLDLKRDIPSVDFLLDHCKVLLRTKHMGIETTQNLDRLLSSAEAYTADSVTFAKILSLVDKYDLISEYTDLKKFKESALQSIQNEQNPVAKQEALEHLLLHSTMKDVKLQRQLVHIWGEDQHTLLASQGLPTIDNGSPEFKAALQKIIEPIQETNSATVRYQILSRLADSVQTQRECSQMLKDAVHARSDKSIAEIDNTLRVGEAVLTLTDSHAELRNAIVKFLSNETTPDLTEETTRIARKYMVQANQVSYSQIQTKRISNERVQTALLTYHDNFWNMTLPARAMVMSQLLLPANARDYSYITNPADENIPLTQKQVMLKKNAQKEYSAAFDSVVNTLFPDPKPRKPEEGPAPVSYSKQAREMLHSYDTMLERTGRSHIRPVLLAILMSASQQSPNVETANIGERLALILEMMGAAEIKTGQMAGGHKDTPIEIASGLQRLKDKAAEPARWDMWDMIDKSVPPDVLNSISHIGEIRGSASLYIAVDADMKKTDGKQASQKILSLKRPYAEARAQQGFDMINGVIEVMQEKGDMFSPEFAKNLHEMATQAKEMISIETRTDIGVVQMHTAQTLKGHKTVHLRKPPANVPNEITFNHAAWSDYGDSFRLMEKMQGKSFNSSFGIEWFRKDTDGTIELKDSEAGILKVSDVSKLPKELQERLEQKQAYAAAHWMMMMQTILACGPLEQDAHGGNWNLDATTGSINSFDDGMIHATQDAEGKVSITKPTKTEIKAMGSALCDTLTLLMDNKNDSQASIDTILQESMEKIAEAHHGVMPTHLLRVERALIALSDTSNYLSKETMADILVSLYKNKQMHPTIQSMVTESLGFTHKMALKAYTPAYSLSSQEHRVELSDATRWHSTSHPAKKKTDAPIIEWGSTVSKYEPDTMPHKEFTQCKRSNIGDHTKDVIASKEMNKRHGSDPHARDPR